MQTINNCPSSLILQCFLGSSSSEVYGVFWYLFTKNDKRDTRKFSE